MVPVSLIPLYAGTARDNGYLAAFVVLFGLPLGRSRLHIWPGSFVVVVHSCLAVTPEPQLVVHTVTNKHRIGRFVACHLTNNQVP